jgi:superfamily II DNA helicase RecQ
MVVISPLKTLMNDQVEFLGNFGILVINIQGENDPEITQQVKTRPIHSGNFS